MDVLTVPKNVTIKIVTDVRAADRLPELPAFLGADRWVSTIPALTENPTTAVAFLFLEEGRVVDVWANSPMSICIDGRVWVMGRRKGENPLRVKAIEGLERLMKISPKAD